MQIKRSAVFSFFMFVSFFFRRKKKKETDFEAPRHKAFEKCN